MTQTANGWTFNMGQTEKKLNDISSDLDGLVDGLGSTSAAVKILEDAVSDLSGLSDYVMIDVY